MIIAIDGPAGTGKTSIADLLASKLKIIHLDSGAIYRSLAYLALGESLTPPEVPLFIKKNPNLLRFSFANQQQQIFLKEKNIVKEIRTKQTTKFTKNIADCVACREWVNDFMRKIAQKFSLIVDGRDIGSIVFPNADLKIYLTASAEIRIQRRAKEKNIQVGSSSYQTLADEITLRDEQDYKRKIAPLQKDKNAITVDTSHLTKNEVVEKIYQIMKEKN